MASSIRCACATCACSDIPTCCFPTPRSCPNRARRRRCSLLEAQLLVECSLEPQQSGFVVQAGAVEQEHILRALAESVDLRAGHVDVRLGERVRDPCEQPGAVTGNDLEDV